MTGHATPPRAAGGVVAIVLASVLWGTTGTAAAFLPRELSPLAIGAITFGVGGALLALTSARRSLRVIAARGSRRAVVVGGVGVIAYALAFYSGMELAGVAIGNVVALGSAPVFAALMETVIDRRAPARSWFLATSAAVVGIVLLAVGAGGAAGRSVALGVACGTVAGASYALYTVSSGRIIARGTESRAVLGAMFGLASIPLLVLGLAIGGAVIATPASVGIAAYLVGGPMVCAYLLFGRGLRSVSASTATTVSLLEPLVATLLAVLVLQERLGPVGWLGAALVLLGLVVVISASRSSREPRQP